MELTPQSGFNVVGVDTFERLGEELYLVSWHARRRDAEAKCRRMAAANPTDRFYVYARDTITIAAARGW